MAIKQEGHYLLGAAAVWFGCILAALVYLGLGRTLPEWLSLLLGALGAVGLLNCVRLVAARNRVWLSSWGLAVVSLALAVLGSGVL